MIKDRLGQPMYGTNTWHTDQVLEGFQKGDLVDYSIRFPLNLGVGNYSVSTALTGGSSHLAKNYEWFDLALVFNVYNSNKVEFVGCAWIQPDIEFERVC